MINTNKLLTIAISTNSKNLDVLIKKVVFELSSISNNIIFLIVVQGNYNIDDVADYPKHRVSLLLSDTTGLSRSRNIAINNVNTPWLWFQDDDIELNVNVLGELIDALINTTSDVFLTKILSLESKNHYYKNYSYYGLSKKRIALRASSIEIIVKKDFLLKNNVKFDTRIGLGTSYPCGEENLLLLQIIKKGGRLSLSDIAPSFHTTQKKNRNKNSTGHYVARGILLQEFSFILAFFIAIKWSINERDNNNIFSTFRHVVKGYFKK